MLEKGSKLADYRVDGVIGRGGMGIVYEATQLSLGRKVALKVLPSHLGDDGAFRERFRREGHAQAALDHDHIVKIYEAGETEDGLFLSMQLVRGCNLKDLVMAEALDWPRTLRLLAPIADALDTAHAGGLIHRDIKPQNILVDSSDHSYLADFGLTKARAEESLTKSGGFVGTVDYISPEQICGIRASEKSDLYALTAVLYECLTGVVPYPKDSEVAVLYAHVHEPTPRVIATCPDLPAGLDEVIGRGMAKAPEQRYDSASELVDNIEHTLNGATRRPALTTARASAAVAPALTATVDGRAPTAARAPTSQTVRAAPRSSLLRRWRLRPRLFGVVAAGLVAVPVAGFLAGRSTSGEEPPAPTNFASAGGLELSFSNGWERATNPAEVPGIEFQDKIALSRAGRRGSEGLVAGRVAASGPTLLPPTFLRRLRGGAPPQNDAVRMGTLEAYRYRNLVLEGSKVHPTLYVSPTSRGVATVACVPDARNEQRFLTACERVATSLELTAGKSFPLRPDRDYADTVKETIGAVNSARFTGRRRLSEAKTPARQARVASALASTHSKAAPRIERLLVSPAVRPVNSAIAAALADAASGYDRMASGARHTSKATYDSGRRIVGRSEKALQRALGHLEHAGYTVR